MAQDDPSLNDEKPLDPAVLRVQTKLRRLLMGSSLIMVLGFIAVFGAIYYRITKNSDTEDVQSFANSSSAAQIAAHISLPTDLGVLVDVSLSRGNLVASFENGTDTYTVLVINRADGAIVERFEMKRTSP